MKRLNQLGQINLDFPIRKNVLLNVSPKNRFQLSARA